MLADHYKVDIGIIDHGFSAEQATKLRAFGYRLVVPEWTLNVPTDLRNPKQMGLVARTALRDYFPGYRVYLWFDGDAWAQTPEFLLAYLEGAASRGTAVAPENGTGYRPTLAERRWWVGNMIAAFGVMRGLRLGLETSVNIGIVALSDISPQWEAWINRYQQAIDRTGKLNLDQHAFQAAMRLDTSGAALVSPRFNWICTLSTPVWDQSRKLLCDPGEPHEAISVVHLAGPNKLRKYELPVVGSDNRVVAASLIREDLAKLSDLTLLTPEFKQTERSP
ncbi:hypothetical protein [Bradyrhizobium sp. RDM12]